MEQKIEYIKVIKEVEEFLKIVKLNDYSEENIEGFSKQRILDIARRIERNTPYEY